MTARESRVVAGAIYLERGQPVEIVVGLDRPEPTDDDRAAAAALADRFPAVRTRRFAPRNVAVRRGDGSTVVRPFRGLRKPV